MRKTKLPRCVRAQSGFDTEVGQIGRKYFWTEEMKDRI